MIKIKKIRNLSETELKEKIVFLQKELFNKKLQLNLAKLKDTSIIKKIKKEIAKIKTVIREKELLEKRKLK
ncbi:50S ribosomal protein L29 [Candidatus Phytoplasma oryzae]|uniref:50S ribosomal protein L29 n=1 Tax=Candidatus Phytoplasma oryzae TaxID=203274 RepID=UPI001C65A33B|nr:50S ribosomal protein L29 [Candidatus Phytoplasma oryzae]